MKDLRDLKDRGQRQGWNLAVCREAACEQRQLQPVRRRVVVALRGGEGVVNAATVRPRSFTRRGFRKRGRGRSVLKLFRLWRAVQEYQAGGITRLAREDHVVLSRHAHHLVQLTR